MSSQQEQEDILLQDYSKRVSLKSSVLFIANAVCVSAIPIWLFSRILHLDLNDNAILYAIITIISAYLVYFAYKNCKFFFKHDFAQKREEAVRKEVNANSKLSRKEKDDLILTKKIEVADYEATNYSIFYNNIIYLASVVLASTVLFAKLSTTINYILTILVSSALIAILSTGTQKKA